MSLKIEKDFSKLKALKRQLRELTHTDIQYGFFEEDRYGPENNNLPVAAVAYWNEYGTDFNPERAFFRSAILQNKKIIDNLVAPIFRDVLSGDLKLVTLESVGEKLKLSVERSIETWTTPPNSIQWFKHKASVGAPLKPLEYTQKMLDSVKYKIRRRVK